MVKKLIINLFRLKLIRQMLKKKILNYRNIVLFIFFAFFFTDYHKYTENSQIADKSLKKEGIIFFPGNKLLEKLFVEVADEQKERQKGLMWRKTISFSEGILFVFNRERPLSFWMKNTYISLDIIYLNKSGRVVRIIANTTPLSEQTLKSEWPAKYALEVKGGFCQKFGISEGDLINFQIFESRTKI